MTASHQEEIMIDEKLDSKENNTPKKGMLNEIQNQNI